MPTSTAISAQGTKVYIAGTPGSALSITAITKAAQASVTATNTLAAGDIVKFGVVAGMPEIKGRIGVVISATGSAFVVNIDTSAYATVGTTGAATPQTFVKIGNVRSFNGFDGTATELDRTNFDSEAMENFPGLIDFGQLSFELDIDDTDVGQLAMRASQSIAAQQAGTAIKVWKLILPNQKVRTFDGWVKKFNETGAVNAIDRGSVDVRITGTVIYA